jgi:hypothetical protein
LHYAAHFLTFFRIPTSTRTSDLLIFSTSHLLFFSDFRIPHSDFCSTFSSSQLPTFYFSLHSDFNSNFRPSHLLNFPTYIFSDFASSELVEGRIPTSDFCSTFYFYTT